jgi:phosphoglycerate dehydrogenase-like enzyme
MNKPLVLCDPHPRRIDSIFPEEDKRRLESLARVVWFDGKPAPNDHVDQHLADAVALIGQTPMPKERLDHAPSLRAIFNVEGNFLPNIDYEECHRRNIHVLSCAPAFAPAVAEMALGLAFATARGIVTGDAAMRAGDEVYGGASNQENYLLRGKPFGLLGCGNVGRALLPLLRGFGGEILVHDPWLHPHMLADLGTTPVELNTLLGKSRILFILAAATAENQGVLGREEFNAMQRGAIVVLVSRATVVDFDALLDAASSGHIRAAIDVFPQEPLPPDHPARKTPNVVLSAHRAGGLPETYQEVGRMVVDDLELILKGLRPQRMQRAEIETVGKLRSRPVA